MKTKGKRIIGILLSLALMFTMMPALGMSLTAYANSSTNYVLMFFLDGETKGSMTTTLPCTFTKAGWLRLAGLLDTSDISEATVATGDEQYLNLNDGNLTISGAFEGSKSIINVTKWHYPVSITCEEVIEYPLWVGGTQVTSANAANITGAETVTASYDVNSNTLTLNGYIYSGESEGVKYTGDGELTIVLTGTNKITSSKGSGGINGGYYGILTFSGTGSLSVNSSTGLGAIYTAKDITVESGNVTAEGSVTGVRSESGNVTVNDGTITASGLTGILAKDITIGGGSVNATGAGVGSAGINGGVSVTIKDGTVTASGVAYGIVSNGVTIKDGTVKATGTGNDSYGILAYDKKDVTIEGGEVVATGNTQGIYGTVKNSIAGTGWTDTAGTEGEAAIPINADQGQELPYYKKVQFPAEVEEVTVKFDSAGGSAVKEQTINKGAKATKPADPQKSGYTFDGWYNGKKAFDFNTAVNENITLTAHWKENVKPTPKKPQTVGKTTVRNTVANTAKKSSIVIYDAVPGATGYDIAYKNKNSNKWVIKKVGKTTRATIGGLTVGGMYQIKVRAKKAETANYKAATGAWSPVINRYFHTTQKIRLASKAKRSFTMSWKKNPQATGYQVMFSTNKDGSGAARNINTVGKNATSFTKVGLKSGKTYYVQVREIKKVGGANYIGNISKPVPVKVK